MKRHLHAAQRILDRNGEMVGLLLGFVAAMVGITLGSLSLLGR